MSSSTWNFRFALPITFRPSFIRLPIFREVLTLLAVYLVIWLFRVLVYRPWTSPLKDLQAPPGGKGLAGHFHEISDLYNHEIMDDWVQKYGPTFRVNGMCWVNDRIWTIDPRAVKHVLDRPYEYRKPALLRAMLTRYMKEGLVPAEGERHRIQRKVVSKLFSGGALKSYVGLIQEKTNQLRDIMLDLTTNMDYKSPYASTYTPPPITLDSAFGDLTTSTIPYKTVRQIDIYSAVERVLFDLIGQIGIGHKFDATGNWNGEGGKMFHDYDKMQQMVPGAYGLRRELSLVFPGLETFFPTEAKKRVDSAMKPMEDLSRKRINEVREELKNGKREGLGYPDLLTLMVLANNTSTDTEEQIMHDHEITGQLATFMFAGTDTTTNVLAFGFHQLAITPNVQTALRAECLEYGESLSFDQIDNLHYLDAVVKEMLRCFPSVPSTIREATHSDIIPLLHPITNLSGELITSIHIRKGQIVHLPIENLNMAQSIWGEDAREFEPERWLQRADSTDSTLITGTATPEGVGEGPGVWSNVMTFIDGPRRCVGYKLGIMQMKIILYTLIREFEFGAVPDKEICKTNMISTRPYVDGELMTTGYSLPLLVRLHKGT